MALFRTGGKVLKLGGKTITANGTYKAKNDGLDAYDNFIANLPFGTKTISTSGTYKASTDGKVGYSQVTVTYYATRTNKLIGDWNFIPTKTNGDYFVYANRAGGWQFTRNSNAIMLWADSTDLQGSRSGTAFFGLTSASLGGSITGVGNLSQDWGIHAQKTTNGQTVYIRYIRDPNMESKWFVIGGKRKEPLGIKNIVYDFDNSKFPQSAVDSAYFVLKHYK